jgi:hypothetical protein
MISLPIASPFVVLVLATLAVVLGRRRTAVSTLLECGLGPCPDNPPGSELLAK